MIGGAADAVSDDGEMAVVSDGLVHPVLVAAEFLKRARDAGDSISALKLTRLVYLAHLFYLGEYGRPLVTEHALAAKEGPVFHSLAVMFGSSDEPLEIDAQLGRVAREFHDGALGESERHRISCHVDDVYGGVGERTGMQLDRLTRRKGTPWRRVRGRRAASLSPLGWLFDDREPEREHPVICNASMAEYYRSEERRYERQQAEGQEAEVQEAVSV